ncbi:MAG: GDP-L-fucose synthase family protein [Desulfovibrionaceae bacterium]
MSLGRDARIFVAGHRGLVGSALCRELAAAGHENLLTRTHAELDLLDQAAVRAFFAAERPEVVFLAAAKVGGILANDTWRGQFIHENLVIQCNVMHEAMRCGAQRLVFLGSSCIYPRLAPQPIREDSLLSGPLEPTNQPYALAKIAGVEMCDAYNRQYGTRFIPVMPTNLYGERDNFDLCGSHVLPAMLRKFHLARLAQQGDFAAAAEDEARRGPIPDEVKRALGLPPFPPCAPRAPLWGTGRVRREFLHARDMARACVFLAFEHEGCELTNIGCGRDQTIAELAELVARVTGFDGPVDFDSSKPDGTPQKLLDVSRLFALGWRPAIGLEEGLRAVYADYLAESALPSPASAASGVAG